MNKTALSPTQLISIHVQALKSDKVQIKLIFMGHTYE